jgi:hypothetical protein
VPSGTGRLDGDPQLRELAAELLDGIEEFTAAVVAQIRVKVPYYRTEENVAYAENEHAIATNVERVLRSLVGHSPPDVSAAQETGRRRAEQGVPLPIVMAAFRVGFNGIWTHLVQRARKGGVVSSEALVDAASDIWSAHDTFAQAMADAYRDAVFATMLRGEQERSALVAALLQGQAVDETTTWDTADVLRLPSTGPFVVVAAEGLRLAQEALPGAENRLRTGDIASAWHLLPDLHVGIVRLRTDAQLDQLVAHLTPLAQSRVGISPTYPRLTHTHQALRFARMALASAPAGRPGIRLFDHHPLGIAAVTAPEAMTRIVQTVLGPVLELPKEDRTVLLSTLAAWRDNDGSTDAAAKQLFCHPNTVRLRLRRLESATGRLLAHPGSAAELLLALEAILSHPPVDP